MDVTMHIHIGRMPDIRVRDLPDASSKGYIAMTMPGGGEFTIFTPTRANADRIADAFRAAYEGK